MRDALLAICLGLTAALIGTKGLVKHQAREPEAVCSAPSPGELNVAGRAVGLTGDPMVDVGAIPATPAIDRPFAGGQTFTRLSQPRSTP